MRQPVAAPESSSVEVAIRTLPPVPSTTTQYVVLADSVVFAGAVKVRVPEVSDGLVRVATSVVADGSPVANFTVKPDGVLLNFTSTLLRVYPPELDPVVNPCALSTV